VILAAIAFAPGLALGSFLNVVAARLPEGRSLVRPRSACGSCGAEIAWHDNVPVVSYFLLRGRCRSCGATFSARYPAVEIATALLVAACFWRFGLTGEAVVGAYFCATLVVLSAIDAERRILPDLIVLPSFVIVLTANMIIAPDRWREWLGASLFLFLALVAYPRGMGMGDVKLALLLGAALGWPVSVGLMIGMVSALVASSVLFARYGLAARKMAIPFGPFLAFGSIIALFVGQQLLDSYLSHF
jgi:leader peptidase (prepilin peptidase) / N-methyltransferase